MWTLEAVGRRVSFLQVDGNSHLKRAFMRKLSMHTVKEVLRLKYLGNLSNRNIELLGIASKSAVSNYTSRFERSGLGIDEALQKEARHLLSLFFPELTQYGEKTDRPHSDWNYVQTELSKKQISWKNTLTDSSVF